jgi:hypothetical protein
MAQRQEKSQRGSQTVWQAHVHKQQKSGLSRAEYCRRQNLSYHALTYWTRKLSHPRPDSPILVPVPLKNVRHRSSAAEPGSGIKITLGGNIAIEVSENFSSSALVRVIAVLEGR